MPNSCFPEFAHILYPFGQTVFIRSHRFFLQTVCCTQMQLFFDDAEDNKIKADDFLQGGG